MQVEAVRVAAGQVAEEAVAVLVGAEAGADGPPHVPEAVDRADGRPRVLRPAERDVRAGAAVAGVVVGHAVVVVDHELDNVAVLPEVLRLVVWRVRGRRGGEGIRRTAGQRKSREGGRGVVQR